MAPNQGRQLAEDSFEWRLDKEMKGNSCRYLLVFSRSGSSKILLGESLINKSLCEKHVGHKIDHQLIILNITWNVYLRTKKDTVSAFLFLQHNLTSIPLYRWTIAVLRADSNTYIKDAFN